MSYSEANDPYGQPSLPYQSYRGPTDFLLSQQQECVSSSATQQPGVSSAQPAKPVRAAQTAPPPPRLSKAEALAFVGTCKRWLVAGSLVAFAILGGLAAEHVVGATSHQTTPASNTPSISSPSSSDGGFFQQGGGYGFGNGNSPQSPISGSHTS